MTRIDIPEDLRRLSYRVRGAAYRVHTALGPCMREEVYRRCLRHALQQDGFVVTTAQKFTLDFEGLLLKDVLETDLIVEGRIVLELKARAIQQHVWDAQLLSYLEHTGLPLGYLINFHVAHLRDGIRPMINREVLPGTVHPVHPVHPVQPPVAGLGEGNLGLPLSDDLQGDANEDP